MSGHSSKICYIGELVLIAAVQRFEVHCCKPVKEKVVRARTEVDFSSGILMASVQLLFKLSHCGACATSQAFFCETGGSNEPCAL